MVFNRDLKAKKGKGYFVGKKNKTTVSHKEEIIKPSEDNKRIYKEKETLIPFTYLFVHYSLYEGILYSSKNKVRRCL